MTPISETINAAILTVALEFSLKNERYIQVNFNEGKFLNKKEN
jgi:hypothetical protein